MLYDILEDAFKSVKNMFSGTSGEEIKTRFCQYIDENNGRDHCLKCMGNRFRIFETRGYKPPVGRENHPNCHCYYREIKEMPAGSISKMGMNAPDVWLKAYGMLPDYYIDKKEAMEVYGWNSRRNTIAGKAPGKMIGGDSYDNKDHKLPETDGRIWYECDVDYESGKRGSARLFYSNDGLMFYSRDHGGTDFVYIY